VAPRHPAILGLNFMLKDKIKARVYVFLKIIVLAHKEIAHFPPVKNACAKPKKNFKCLLI